MKTNPVLDQDECHELLRQWKERQRDEGCRMKREIRCTSDTVEEGKQRQETGLKFVVLKEEQNDRSNKYKGSEEGHESQSRVYDSERVGVQGVSGR